MKRKIFPTFILVASLSVDAMPARGVVAEGVAIPGVPKIRSEVSRI